MLCGSEKNQHAALGGKSYKSEKVTEEKNLWNGMKKTIITRSIKKMHQWSSDLFSIRKKPKPKGEVNHLFGSTPNT